VKRNIDTTGRVARGGLAIVFLLIGGYLLADAVPVLGTIFAIVGLFCAFEAWRAWCVVRACGFKLPW